RGDNIASTRFDQFIHKFSISLATVTAAQAAIARDAWQRFGEGSKQPAQLNFGDCLAYGLARSVGEPLLFKVQEFAQTDIEPALKA
ncbi:MAG: type II toxin-antitoxin system VapC family toxin, partial [Acetobacteraceae bacterium]|nr:type II toxin-antitoxin system VapC family toxin [Acetobacteraceae bacterium]